MTFLILTASILLAGGLDRWRPDPEEALPIKRAIAQASSLVLGSFALLWYVAA